MAFLRNPGRLVAASITLLGGIGLVAASSGCGMGCTAVGPPSGLWLRAEGGNTDPYGVADLAVTACLRDQCRPGGLSAEGGLRGTTVSGALDLPPPTGPEPLDLRVTVRRGDRVIWGPGLVTVRPATVYPNGRDCGASYVGHLVYDGTTLRDDGAAAAEAIDRAGAGRR